MKRSATGGAPSPPFRRPAPARRVDFDYRRHMARSFLSLAAVSLLLGCPPAEKEKKSEPAPSAVCTKFGATCEVSPGKLGTCVTKEPCATGECFVCQSQH